MAGKARGEGAAEWERGVCTQPWEPHWIAAASRGNSVWGVSVSRLLKQEMRAHRARVGLIPGSLSSPGVPSARAGGRDTGRIWDEAEEVFGMRLKKFLE